MSEPVLPRYSVGSVTGWPISGSNGVTSSRSRERPAPEIWYVHDRLVGYHVVEEYPGRGGGGYSAEARAQRRCDELNAEYENWLRDQGALP